jgi:hypothetical protein
MELGCIQYTHDKGWSSSAFPDLDSERTLVLLFGASEFLADPAPVAELSRAFPKSLLLGCSTAGEIFGSTLHDKSISVAAMRFGHTRLRCSSAGISNAGDSFQAGVQIAKELSDPALAGVFVLSDGTNVNGSKLVQGLNHALPCSVVVTGGLAGDGSRFQSTWVLQDRAPKRAQISAVGFYGDKILIGHGSKGGWDIFGPERTVTRSRDNVLFELDGKPALKIYKEYLGELASGLPATALLFPLALRTDQDDFKAIVRTVLSVDEASQSMTFAGDVPEGARTQLMRANFDRLIDGASDAAAECSRSGNSSSSTGQRLSVAISCVGRRLILGERVEEELEATLGSLPNCTSQVGFYSYGEISPRAAGHCDLHNQTMTVTSLGEVG